MFLLKKLLPKTKDVPAKFVEASVNKDFELLESLLAENGIFDIQNESFDTEEVSKNDFMMWFKEKLSDSSIMKVDYDQCLHCFIGNPVILFNDGQFPRKIKGSYERSKTGLMLDIKYNRIQNLKFCFVFAETENKYVIDCTQKY